MSISRKKMNNSPVPSDESLEELLRRMAPELGLQLESPGRRRSYHFFSRLRHYVPKAVALALLCMVLALAMLLVSAPVEFRDVTVQPSDGLQEIVTFRLNQLSLVGGVEATIDGRAVPVLHDGWGRTYHVATNVNGELAITAMTMAGRKTVQRMIVDSIDTEPPVITGENHSGGEMFIYVSDGDGTGIDWESMTTVFADTDEPYEDVYVNTDEGCIRVVIPDESLRICISDVAGNRLAMRVNVSGG